MKRIIVILSVLLAYAVSADAQKRNVDYRYAPQWHCSTPAFPDDSCKTIVGPRGEMLYDYGGPFFPYTQNLGFNTAISFLADENQAFSEHKLISAKTPVTETSWEYDGVKINQTVFSTAADIEKYAELRHPQTSDREDMVLIVMDNKSGKAVRMEPLVIVNSIEKVRVSGQEIMIGGKAKFMFSHPVKTVNAGLSPHKTVVALEAVELEPGQKYTLCGLYDNGMPSALREEFNKEPENFPAKAEMHLDKVVAFWENGSDIPYGRISVPDKEIQNLIDASIRGVWQAREIKDGNISFQVGPTCYRGLWIVDGAFISETAAMLGCGEDARNGIEHSLSFQKPSGEFAKLNPTFWKENGIILWTCVRYARLTRDKEWLENQWDKLAKTVDFIKVLRERTFNNSTPLDDGLIPAGYIDGGLNGSVNTPEYSNTIWNLVGLKAMIGAAEWLGRTDDAKRWSEEYDDFYATFRKAADRDMAEDVTGNRYLNNIMDPSQRSLPQRAQWAFCQSVYPGQIFDADDPIATGTMAMLDNSLQEGLVVGTGWLDDGLWNYFASFYGHASLWVGKPDKAVDALYAFANHASSLYAWREEQTPHDMQMKFVGEMPHNWGSAEFVRLAVHLLALDRGEELHLLEGMPEEWLAPGMETVLSGIATPFGNLDLKVTVTNDGKHAYVRTGKLPKNTCGGMVLHTGDWGEVDGKNIITLNPEKQNNIKIKLLR